MNTCTNCGASNTPEAFSCGNCGGTLRGAAKTLTGDKTNAQTMGRLAPVGAKGEKKSSIDLSVIGAAAIKYLVIVAILGAAAWWFFVRSTPETAVNKLMTAATKSDLPGLMNCVTTDSRALIPNIEMAKFFVRPPQGDNEEIKVDNVVINGDTATASVSVAPKAQGDSSTSKNAAPPPGVPFSFRKEAGKWRTDLRSMAVGQIRQGAQANPTAMANMRTMVIKGMAGNPTAVNAWAAVFKEATGY